MAGDVNRKLVLAERPTGLPDATDFRLEDEPLAPLEDGQVRIDVSHLSIDAFIRTALEPVAHHRPVPIGDVVTAFGVGHVRESRAPGFEPGDAVMAPVCTQTIATLPAFLVEAVDEKRAPLTAYLGVLGMTTGLTAYFGMREVGRVAPGETVLVSAAAGAVGSVAAQIAKLDGGRVIGLAGGPDKCRFLIDDLGLDAAIDYKGEDVDARLRALAPDGVDVYFDNVGGELLDVVLDQLQERARVVICGAISQYQGDMSQGVRGPALYLRLAERNARMEGFTVNRFVPDFPEASAQLADWLAADRLSLPEHVDHGLENFGATLRRMFEGGHTGKLLLAL